ncbi:MAG: hypothetical protein O7I42_13855 [Alphaproteobacteria bacterium]|nr:hypothetical protein [Alphaproteobacteria bacterium]
MAEVLILDAAHLSDVGNFLGMPSAVDQHIAFRALQEIRMRADRSKRYFQFCLPQVWVYLVHTTLPEYRLFLGETDSKSGC